VLRGQRDGRILGFLDRSRYFFFQAVPQLYSRGWVDPVPDPLLLRKSGSAGNRTRDLWICSQELWPLAHRGGRYNRDNKLKAWEGYVIWDIKPCCPLEISGRFVGRDKKICLPPDFRTVSEDEGDMYLRKLGFISHKIALFMTAAVRTSHRTYLVSSSRFLRFCLRLSSELSWVPLSRYSLQFLFLLLFLQIDIYFTDSLRM
jgi:hypothetical protein